MEKKKEARQDKEINLVTEKFLSFLSDVSIKSKREKQYQSMSHYYGSNGATVQWGEIPLSEAIETVRKQYPNISAKRIRKSFHDLMLKMIEERFINEQVDVENTTGDFELESITEILDLSNVTSNISQMIVDLKNSVRKHIVFVPVEGLTMRVDSLEIETVTFCRRFDTSELNQALNDIEKDVIGDTTFLNRDLKRVDCYSRLEVEGDNDFIRDEAIRRTKEAIHILNLYLSSSTHQPKWAAINTEIENSHIIIRRILSDKEDENNRVGFTQYFLKQRQVEINEKNQVGLKAIISDFLSQNNTNIGKRLQRAITWYSKAVDTNSPDEKFVNLAISLESLVIGSEGDGEFTTTGSINQKIGERVAFLLGNDFNSRIIFEKKAKTLYGLRSKIVHQGESVKEKDVVEMDKLVNKVIFAILKHQFKSWEEFLVWMAHEKYDKVANNNTDGEASN